MGEQGFEKEPHLLLGLGSSGIREQGFFLVQRFGEEINPPPPGPASTGVLPIMPAVVASIRGRTNSLVIIAIEIKKRDPVGSLVFIVLDHDNASSYYLQKLLHILCVDQSLAVSSWASTQYERYLKGIYVLP